MKKTETLTEYYVRSFRKYLWLYPKKHRQEYGDQMLQLLRDQLLEAERLGDRQIAREIYLSALLGLPGSIIREHFSPSHSSGGILSETKLPFGVYSLVVFSLGFLLVFSSYRDSSFWPIASAIVLMILIPVYIFQSTQRLFLSLLALVVGLIPFLFSYLSFGFFPYAIFPEVLNNLWPLVGILIMYALSALYHFRSERFRRVILSDLSEEKQREYKEALQKRRHRNVVILSSIAGIFLAMNLAGLYDPKIDDSDLLPVTRNIPVGQNMYSELNNLTINVNSSDLSTFPDVFLTSWDETRAKTVVKRNSSAIDQFVEASNKPYFQQPGLSNLSGYSSANDAVNVPIMNLSNITTASELTLMKAKLLYSQGRTDEAIGLFEANTRVGLAIANSQDAIITHLVAQDIIYNSMPIIKDFVTSQNLTNSQRAILTALLSDSNLDTRSGAVMALKDEYYVEHLAYTNLRSMSLSDRNNIFPGGLLAFLPYSYQPNRTDARFAEHFRQEIENLNSSCAGVSETYSTNSVPWRDLATAFGYNGLGNVLADTINGFPNIHFHACEITNSAAEIRGILAAK